MKVHLPLPVRDGVAPSYLWLDQTPDSHALAYLVQRFPDVGTDVWQSRMARGEVVDEDDRHALHARDADGEEPSARGSDG